MQYTIRPNDTLALIAQRHYGDAGRYREIAAANGISDPNRIHVGQVIELPDLDERQGLQPPADSGATEGAALTAETLKEIMPAAGDEEIDRYLPALQRELPAAGIDTPLRIAHFIAQIAHESGSLRLVEENLNYSAKALRAVFGKYFTSDEMAQRYARKPQEIANIVYADRMGNGDGASGDGWRYRGRGLIQLTGRDNYQACSAHYATDYVGAPERIAQEADSAVRAACWFWDHNGLNRYADADDVRAVTRRINGGYHGLEDREAFLERAKRVLGLA